MQCCLCPHPPFDTDCSKVRQCLASLFTFNQLKLLVQALAPSPHLPWLQSLLWDWDTNSSNSLHFYKGHHKQNFWNRQVLGQETLFQRQKKFKKWKIMILRGIVKSPRQRNYTSDLSIEHLHHLLFATQSSTIVISSYHQPWKFANNADAGEQCRFQNEQELKWSQSWNAPWMPSCVGGICQCLA